MSAIGIALVGAGNWANYAHLPALQRSRRFEVIAVAARSGQSARDTAAQFGIPLATADVSELLRHPKIQAITVLSRVPQHEQLVLDAIAAGKHVYCEWPLGISALQASRMLAAANSAGVTHVVGLQRRLAPSVRWFRKLIESGFVGRVRSVNLQVSEPHLHAERGEAWAAFTADPRNFSNLYAIYGGHYLDVLLSTFGPPREISARLITQFPELRVKETGALIPSGSADQLVACGEYGDGAALSVHVEGGKRFGSGVRLTVTGTEGDLVLSGTAAFKNLDDHQVAGARMGGSGWQTLAVPESFSWVDCDELPAAVVEVAHAYEAFARRILGELSEAVTFEDAYRLHVQMELIAESSRTGRVAVIEETRLHRP